MRHPDVFLTNGTIYLRGIKLCMSKKAAHLLNRHASVECVGRHGSAETVWMDIIYSGAAAKLPEHPFNTVFAQTPIRLVERDKQSWIVIDTAVQVHLKVYAGRWSYIGLTFFETFAKDSNIVAGKVDVRAV